jgi:signal transduction histidine kinase
LFKRSILIGVAVAYLVSLACGLLVAHFIAEKSYNRYVSPTFEAMDRLELQQATKANQEGGRALIDYMRSLDQAFGGKHYLLSGDGIDLVTGQSKAFLLPIRPHKRYRGYDHGVFHLAQLSDDGHFCFAVYGTSNETGPATWAYFAVCIIVTTGLLLFSLLYLVFPLRRIRDALGRFGNGQMELRIASQRTDEIGQVAATFNGMAERVEQSFRTERALLQDISHELRAPLARLELAVRLAKSERTDDLTEQIERNVNKLSALVGEITEFHQRWSVIENSWPLEDVDLAQIVTGVVRDALIEAAPHFITIEVVPISVTLHSARCDLISRALENILRNAIIHSHSNSKIEVAMMRDASEVSVTVRDFGEGVPLEGLERIFDPFYREQSSRNEQSGLGLGLSIARRGIQWHGGTLRAENAKPGLKLIAIFPVNQWVSQGLR